MRVEFPHKFLPLLQPCRYKIAYGGRAGIKSWQFARSLLILGMGDPIPDLGLAARDPLRILCAREIQKSIRDSVHKLLSDQIRALGIQDRYEVQRDVILGRKEVDGKRTEFMFAGLKHNIDNLKSAESIDIAWVEEAQTASDESWKKLIPTIRKPGSEIWISFNPELEADPTNQRFAVHPPEDSLIIKTSYRDNPWISQETLADIAHDRRTMSEEEFQHIWEGVPKSAVSGSVYESELRAADAAGRITNVPYDPAAPVHTFWDLGWNDSVSIWMAQVVGFEYRVIDYIENSQKPISFYLQELQKRPYVWGKDYLPWDGGTKQLGTGKSIQELMAATGRTVVVNPQLRVLDGINAVRTIFPNLWIDKVKCTDGIHGLRHYKWDETSAGTERREPLHTWASHPADALRTMAVAIKRPKETKPKGFDPHQYSGGSGQHGWQAF